MNLKNLFNLSEKNDRNISEIYTEFIGDLFYKLGFRIASAPWQTIIITIIISFVLGLGNIKLYQETNPMKLWVPSTSSYQYNTEWMTENFEEGHREEIVIITANNVLEPKILMKLAILTNKINNFNLTLKNETVVSWDDLCFQIPSIVDFVDTNDNYNSEEYDDVTSNSTELVDYEITERPYNFAVDASPEIFCRIVNSLPNRCRQNNILEIWKYDTDQLANLTLNDVINAVNKLKISRITGHPVNYEQFLSGITRDREGNIIKASSIMLNWYLYLNFTEAKTENLYSSAGVEYLATEVTYLWEGEFTRLIEEIKLTLEDENFKIYYETQRSMSDSFSDDIDEFSITMIISSIMMFFFMQIVLSKFNWIEIRLILGTSGLLCIGLTTIITCGICALFRVPFTPVSPTFPFLLMGLGVDDMFVVMASWRKINENIISNDKTIPEKIGLTLKHSAISITVTTVTDLIAFIVGTTTSIPAFRDYCIYSAIGVLVIYILVITIFMAIFALDERRIEAKRNSFIPCIVHSKEKSRLWCDKQLFSRILKFTYSKGILTLPGKIIVIAFTIALASFSCISILKVEKFSDSSAFISKTSQYLKYLSIKKEFYPDYGQDGGFYIGPVSLETNETLINLNNLARQLKSNNEYISDISSWIEPFRIFVQLYFNEDIFSSNLTGLDRRFYLSKFLLSPDGGKYQANIRLKEKLKCGQPTSIIQVSSIQFNHLIFSDLTNIRAMAYLYEIANELNSTVAEETQYSMVWSKSYLVWSLIEVIDIELLKNIILTLVCVMICTAIMILDVQTCFWILITVILTILNLGGFMYVWDLKISTLTCLGFLIAIGLCVDYAAHVGHTFLSISEGTRNERTLETVLYIGPAIIYGATSTILSVSTLSVAKAVSAYEFFKYISLIVSFGLYNGLILLPVILSLIGSKPYKKCKVDS